MKASALLLPLGALVAGGLGGMWMDWSAHKATRGPTLTYELRDGKLPASLQVRHLDTIKLVPAYQGKATNLAMTFSPSSPCDSSSTPDTCHIDKSAKDLNYTFTCSDTEGDTCPDPAIQQKDPPGSIMNDRSFSSAVKENFAYLVGPR